MAGPNLSTLIESQLPDFIVEEYPLVTNFLSKYYEALTISEGPQDIINNFERFLDVDTFAPEVLVKTCILQQEIPLGTTKIDILANKTDGFPRRNGLIMIDQEIFLYERVEGNVFKNAIRGYSAKTKLGDLYNDLTYEETNPQVHKQFAEINNLSNLLLAGLIKNYEEQYTSGFPYQYLRDETNKNLLVKKIRDFYNVKGTPQSLEFIFQMLFSVKPDIFYPKESVFKSSESGWNSKELLVVEVIDGDIRKIVGNEIRQTPDPYNPELTPASAIIDNIVGEPYQGSLQYTLTISPGSKEGQFAIARRSFLMTDLSPNAGRGDRIDVFSTVGFPEQDGRVLIGEEQITYSSKTATQFVIHERDAGVENKRQFAHKKGVRCFTKNNLAGVYLDENNIEQTVNLRIYGLIASLASTGIEGELSAGLEYDPTAQNYFDVDAGGIPYVTFDNMVEFSTSGFYDSTPLTNEWIINESATKLTGFDPTNLGSNSIKNTVLSNVQAIYRDRENYFIASSGFPEYAIGPFDNIAIPQDQQHLKIFPRKPLEASTIQYTDSEDIGLYVNGVPIINHKSVDGIDFGALTKINITNTGARYTAPPKVIIEGNATATCTINGSGQVDTVTITDPGSGYSTAPNVTFTSGSGGQITHTISQGQIENIYLDIDQTATVIDPGQNYTEPPMVVISDASGKGRGALFTCQIDTATGQITGFTKLSGGFDYQLETTTVVLAPTMRTAEGTSELVRWKYNSYLYNSIDNSNSAGVVFNSSDARYGLAYGHIIPPTSLKISRSDNVDSQGNPLTNKSHSPILGWAYDGNPIYGSFGYQDPYQDVYASNASIARMSSSWRLKSTRGTDAPSETQYSLGTFCNDYEYVARLGDLDANNGRFCTTPEFPNGTYAYFCTTDSLDAPAYPYTIGDAYYNLPIEENWKPKSRQNYLPDDVRRRRVAANVDTGELLTSRISGVQYGPVTNIEVHSSSGNYTNEDVIYVDTKTTETGDGLFAAVNEIQGHTVASLSCNSPKNNYLITDKPVFINHEATITQQNSGATASVIGVIEEGDKFVVKNVSGTFNLTDAVDSDTEIYNLTFDGTVVADIGDEVVFSAQSGGVAHEKAIGKVIRNVFDKNTVIVELKFANPTEQTSTDTDGNTITLPRDQYSQYGYFSVGDGVALGLASATIVDVNSLSKGFKLLDVEDNIAVLRTQDKVHGLAVGDDVIVTVEPNSSISTQKYFVQTKKYQDIAVTEIDASTAINDSGVARLDVVNAGSGFTPSTTFNNVPLTSSTGSGTSATGNVTTNADGRVVSIVVGSKGSGYKYGDILTTAIGNLGGNVGSNEAKFFVDAAGMGRDDTQVIVDSSLKISEQDVIRITDEELLVTAVAGNTLQVQRGYNDTEVVDHIDDIPVTLITRDYRFNKDSAINFSGNVAYVDSYNPTTNILTVYYINENDTEITSTSTFTDESTPGKQVIITSVSASDLRFRFRKDGDSEWKKNIALDVQRTYQYIFDTSDQSLLGRNLTFYNNVYRTQTLNQAYQSLAKPGTNNSFTTFQLGYGIPIDGNTWKSAPVLDIPPKIYYGESVGLINAEDQFFTLIEDPFAGKHPVFYGYEYEFAYRLPYTPQQEGFTNVQYYTDSLYAIGSIRSVKVISGGKNYTIPPILPGVFLNKRFRGSFKPLIQEGRITSVTVEDTGLNYSKPIVLLENTGSGVNAQFNVELRADGSVSRIVPTNEGTNYSEDTVLRLYESDNKLFAHGEDIGRLATLEIISSGKDFNNDPTLLPQVNPPIVMTLRDMPDKAFLNGELIEQRDGDQQLIATGRVDYWVDGQNILRLKSVTGKFVGDRPITGKSLLSTANIQKIYVANITPKIDSTSTSVGSYGSDRSKLSAVSQKLQDGVYYQDYSYVVKSTVSINDWRDFVKKFTHPAGFNLFGEVLIESFGNARKPETIDTPQSGTKDNGFGAVMSVIEPGVLGCTAQHKSRKITQSHVRVDSFQKQRGLGSINYSEQNNVEIEVFDLALSPGFDGSFQTDGTVTGTTQFTLFKEGINEVLIPFNANQLIVTLDGVLQDPNTAYTVSGSTITFATPPIGPHIDPKTGIFVPGVTFYGKSIKFQDDSLNSQYLLEANNLTSLFDGTTTEFDLGIPVLDGDHLHISLDGVIQEPGVAYELVAGGAGKVKFTEPPRQVGKIVELDIQDATNWLVNDYVVGQTTGARGEIVAKRYFQDHRFLDAGDIVDNNSAVLAEEAVGILDATTAFSVENGFTYPGLGRNQCITDLKSVLKSIAQDLRLGGNANTYAAASEYLIDPSASTGTIKHIEGEVEATLWSMRYLRDMTFLSLRNKFGIDHLTYTERYNDVTFAMQPTDISYESTSGNMTLTIADHGLTANDYIAFAANSLVFTCSQDNHATPHSYPRTTDPYYNRIIDILSVTSDTITVNVGASPAGQQYDHTFVSAAANSVGKYNDPFHTTNSVGNTYIDAASLLSSNVALIAEEAVARMLDAGGTIADPAFNTALPIISATATTITLDVGKSDSPATHTFDSALNNAVITGGNYTHTFQEADTNSIQVTSGPILSPTNASYDPTTGDFVITVVGHTLTTSDTITIADNAFTFRCTMDQNATPHSYPRSTDPASGQALAITAVAGDTFTVNVGASPEVTFTPTNGTYDPLTGMMMLDIGTHTLAEGTSVKLLANGISFNCNYGTGTHIFVSGVGNAITAGGGASGTFTAAAGTTYDPLTGDMVLEIGSHSLTTSNTVTIADNGVTFTCDADNHATNHSYPRATDPSSGVAEAITAVTATTITINVGVAQGSGSIKSYPRASSPGSADDCVDDVKDMVNAIIFNIKYGGNNKVYDAADLYVDRDGFLNHITQKVTETLTVFNNVKTLAADIIRNNIITPVGTHGITQIVDNSITVETNECAVVESTINTLVDIVGGAIQNPDTFETTYTRTIPEYWPIVHSPLPANRDLTITVDYGANPYCAQVESAVNVLFEIVLNTIRKAAFEGENHLLSVTEDFPNPNRIQVEMTKKEFVSGEDIQSEASLATTTIQSTSVIAPGTQQKFFGFKQGKFYKLDSIEDQFNDAQTIFELERNGVPFYAERSQNIIIILNGVIQQNKNAYRVEDNIIVFNEAPAAGSNCFVLYFFGLDPQRILLGYNIEPPGTFSKFFKLTVDQQVVLPVEGANVWVSTDANGVAYPYVQSFSRGRCYKQSWTPGQQNLIFVENVTGQKINWEGGVLSFTRDRGSSASILDVNILSVEETVDDDLREKLFNRQDRIKSNLKPGDLIQIDGEADTRSIIRAAKEALVTSGYDSDNTVSSYFRSYEYEVVLNVGSYSGQREGQDAQAVARIEAELRYHSLTSARAAGSEYLPNDVLIQYNDQNDVNSGVVWSATVKNYIPARKTIELFSNHLDGSPYTNPDLTTFRSGEKVYIQNVAGTESTGLQVLPAGSVNSVVVSKRDNSAYYDRFKTWKQDNVWSNGENLLGGAFVPANASANDISQEYDFATSDYDDLLEPQISKDYREPPKILFRTAPIVDSNGNPTGSPTGGGARANAVVVRGEVVDVEIVSGGSGYKLPPQILFTRGYFIIRKDPLDITNLTTFGIEPVTIDSRAGLLSFIEVFKKGGDLSRFASQLPVGNIIVFGNAGHAAFLVNKSQQVTLMHQYLLDVDDIEMKPQPQILIELAPEDLKIAHQGTRVTQSQMSGGVQGLTCAITTHKKTETKLSMNAGSVEKRADNNPDMVGYDTYTTNSLGSRLKQLEDFKFEIQPQDQSAAGLAGSYQDASGRTINYTMGDMDIGFFSDLFPLLTIGDFENPDVANSQVVDNGDRTRFNFQQGSEIHFSTQTRALLLDNQFGGDVVLVNSTKGFPANGGQFIIGNTTTDKCELMTYTSAMTDRFVGITRVNPLNNVEQGARFSDLTPAQTLNVSLTAGGAGTGNNTLFASPTQYYIFQGGTAGANRHIYWQFTQAETTAAFAGRTTITTEYIRGNDVNGGELPNQDLRVFLHTPTSGYVQAGALWTSASSDGADWSTTTLTIPAAIQTDIANGEAVRIYYDQVNVAGATSDYFAIRSFWLEDLTEAYPEGSIVMSANTF
tara:strand:- start:512 stop:12706 length:12195 start_codon:yes stop_codon:yes gene_type:complete